MSIKTRILVPLAAAAVVLGAATAVLLANHRALSGGAEQPQTEATGGSAANPSEIASDAISSQPSPDVTEAQTRDVRAPEGTQEVLPETTADIALPEGEGSAVFFSASYSPDSKAEEVSTGRLVHLRELFGAGGVNGAITFQEDGSFTDTLSPVGARTGRYRLSGGRLEAIYLPDETMDVTVTEWDGDKPVSFCVVYKTFGGNGYRVFFREK